MAVRWSCENVVAEHRELQASAMALDWIGEHALLAGRRSIALIALDKPTEIIKRSSRIQQKYDVSAAEWSPTSLKGNNFVIAVGERADIFSWSDGTLVNIACLKAHTRTISDLNWHRTDPNLLATCSIDTYIHLWDVRESRRPTASLSAIAGASQVKWNKLNSYLIASSHDCDIRIWDQRKASHPVKYVSAHLSKIQGLDWSPFHENQLASSSNDCTVKFFDIANPRKSDNFINTQSPVWRARFTPFGEGVVTVVVPQLRRVENSLLLWSLMSMSSPVHTFVGHVDVVLEFEWRQNADGQQGDYQLVTWSRDHSLRIWRVDPQLQKLCGDVTSEGILDSAVGSLSLDASTLIGGEECPGKVAVTFGLNQDFDEVRDKSFLEADFSSTPITVSFSQEIVQEALIKAAGVERDENHELPACPEMDSAILLDVVPSSESNVQEGVAVDIAAGSPLTSFSLVGASPKLSTPVLPLTVQQEFSLLNTTLDNTQMDSVEITTDEEKRSCHVTAKQGSQLVILIITFPVTYPKLQPPTFRFSPGTNISPTARAELLKVLKNTASQYVKKKKGCLEPCIRIFVSQMKSLLQVEEKPGIFDTPLLFSTLNYLSRQDYSIPFPRTSGARFCSAGMLVCFVRPTLLRQGATRTEACTPRSLSALGPYINNFMTQMGNAVPTSPQYNYIYPAVSQSPNNSQNVSISKYYYQDRKLKTKRGKTEEGGSQLMKAGNIIVYDITPLLSLSKDMAHGYVFADLDSEVSSACFKNRDVAAAAGHKDLVQVWSLAAAVASLSSPTVECYEELDIPWTHHPFGRKLINSLLDHYLRLGDVQTAAMLSCLFGKKTQNPVVQRNKEEISSKSGGSPYNTVHSLNMDSWDVTAMIRHSRSNSEGSVSEASVPLSVVSSTHSSEKGSVKETISENSFLDQECSLRYDEIRRVYADILYRWNLLTQRAMVLKYVQSQLTVHQGIDFHTVCGSCGKNLNTPLCQYCRVISFMCSICHAPVKGASNFCMICGHGGHANHLLTWFTENRVCPTGCGCDCLLEMEELFS